MLIPNGSRLKVTLDDDSILEGDLSMTSFFNNENFEAEIMLSENRKDFENNQYGDVILPLSCIKSIEVLSLRENYKLPKLQRRWKPKTNHEKSADKRDKNS